MAAFQFSVQQVSFPSDNLSLNSSLDSLSSVIDPNVDFSTKDENSLDKKEVKDITEEWKSATYVSCPKKMNTLQTSPLTSDSASKLTSPKNVSSSENLQSSYPTISFAVAQYMNQNNPELCQGAEKYFTSESFQASHLNNVSNIQESMTSETTPLHSMSVATEALALQQSVIGNFGVKPVSADIVAQVVADTKLRLEQGKLKSKEPAVDIDNVLKKEKGDKVTVINQDIGLKSELIRYPSEAISSSVEKHSWFSNSSTDIPNEPTSKIHKQSSHKQSFLLSKSSSQSSVNSIGHKKSHRTNGTDLPKVHSSTSALSKLSKYNVTGDTSYSNYEIYPDSSVEYETESSLSEKFEVESMCSEAFETESNFSEFSTIDDDVLQMRKNFDIPKISNNFSPEGTLKISDSKSIDTLSIGTASVKCTADKGTVTDEIHNFQLLREKALLEGRLESVFQEQSNLIKEKDHYCSLATAYEAQLKSLQNQLDTTRMEKKNTLLMFDTQSKEHKNWDNIIKEYQGIIEAKNAEIKGLKDDLSESEQANIRTKISYEELKVDLESREGAISGLKKKIAELHVEVQIHLQGKIQLENEVKNVRLEMDTLQKSKEWFQEQLHSTQENRNKLHQQMIQLQSNHTITSNNLEKVLVERNQLKHELMHTQQRAVAEKEILMKQLETIEADMKERESLFDDIQKDKGSAEAVLVDRIRKMEEEKSHLTNLSFTVSNQEHELNVLRSDCEEKGKLLQSFVKEKAELNRQVAVLQKSSNDKDLNIQQLMQELKDINIKMSQSELALKRAEELISALKDERTAADVAFASANADKRVVNESLKAVSENLYKLQNNFKHMKAELVTKSSQNEQLLTEKRLLEETVRKNEESMLLSHREFEQKVLSESQNRNVMFDDLKKKKSDVENVLNVYSKDLLNYQRTIEDLTKQKVELISEISNLKHIVQKKDDEMQLLRVETADLKIKVSDFENKLSNITTTNVSNSVDEGFKEQGMDCQTLAGETKSVLFSKSKAFLYKKLKEKIRECKILRNELETKNVRRSTEENGPDEVYSYYPQFQNTFVNGESMVEDLELQLKLKNQLVEEKISQLKESERTIIELEKEKGKAIGLADKCDIFKQRMAELENKLSERDAHSVQLTCLVEELKGHLADLDASSKIKISNLESDLNKERTVIKSLRQQVFQEKRINSHTQRDLQSLKSALEQANQIADAKKQEIASLQAELFVKMEAELKHRAEIEHFQTEIHLQRNIVEKLNKELEEVKARDPALAEQIKALSWRLKEKSNEVAASHEKIKLMEERHLAEFYGLKKTNQEDSLLLEKMKEELDDTRKEKFSYQSKVIELRKALKSKLAELESKGILRVEKNSSSGGPIIHLNIPDPEVSFDESYVNDLLKKSMHLSESRPLSNLQDCLNSLKEEMVQLQKKIVDSSEKT